MQPSATQTTELPGWTPLAGSWEEAVLSWYEQASQASPRGSKLRRTGMARASQRTRTQPKPGGAVQQDGQ